MNAILNERSIPEATQTHHLPSAPSRDILYVEVEAALRRLSANVLLKSGYRVQVAEDGQAGWEALRLANYDLLITDYEMPRLTGLDLVKRLRSAGYALPVVMAAGSISADQARRDQWPQVATILWKPFTAEQLLETVEEVLCAASGVRKQGDHFFPVLAEASAHIQRPPRWGINE
jgi:CheY-like chemotaxis protein